MHSYNRDQVASIAGEAIRALRESGAQDELAYCAMVALEALTVYATEVESQRDELVEELHKLTNRRAAV